MDISTRPPGTFGPHSTSILCTAVILPNASMRKRIKQSLVVVVDVAAAGIWRKEGSPPQLVMMMVLVSNAVAQ